MQPAAVDMAQRVGLLVLLCLACIAMSAKAQDYLSSGSGSGSGSGYGPEDESKVPIDQEPDEPAEEDKYIAHYVEDPDFNLCERYPHGE